MKSKIFLFFLKLILKIRINFDNIQLNNIKIDQNQF